MELKSRKSNRLKMKYYDYISDWADERRFDGFYLKHELYDFIPYHPFNIDYFSLRADLDKNLLIDTQPSQEPLTYDDCCNYFAGRPISGRTAGYHHDSVLYR